jgi:hypothetical protein
VRRLYVDFNERVALDIVVVRAERLQNSKEQDLRTGERVVLCDEEGHFECEGILEIGELGRWQARFDRTTIVNLNL